MNPLVELLNEAGANPPANPPVVKRPVSGRLEDEMPGGEPKRPATADAEPVAVPGPETAAAVPEEPGASPEPEQTVEGEAKQVLQSTLSVYYHMERSSTDGHLAAVRRIGFNYTWNYTVIHVATRTPLGVTFRSLADAEAFLGAVEKRWDWSFRSISAFGGNGITQEALFRLAGEFDGADMFGNLIRSSFTVN